MPISRVRHAEAQNVVDIQWQMKTVNSISLLSI